MTAADPKRDPKMAAFETLPKSWNGVWPLYKQPLSATMKRLSVSVAKLQAEMEIWQTYRPARVDTPLCSKEYVLYQLKAPQERIFNLPCYE